MDLQGGCQGGLGVADPGGRMEGPVCEWERWELSAGRGRE